jgi:hypothetical protein
MAVGRKRHCTGSRLCSGYYAEVENVNAMLCGRCGMRSVPGKTALKISDAVERLFRPGKDLDMTGISFHKARQLSIGRAPATASALARGLLIRPHAQSRLAQKLAPFRPAVQRRGLTGSIQVATVQHAWHSTDRDILPLA